MAVEKNSPHFRMIFWYIVYITTIVLGYVFCVTFLHVPKENMRFVDIAFGFLLGSVLGTAISYLLVGSPDKKINAPVLPAGTVHEVSATSTTTTTTASDTTES